MKLLQLLMHGKREMHPQVPFLPEFQRLGENMQKLWLAAEQSLSPAVNGGVDNLGIDDEQDNC